MRDKYTYGRWKLATERKRYDIGREYDPREVALALVVSNSVIGLRCVCRGWQFAIGLERDVIA